MIPQFNQNYIIYRKDLRVINKYMRKNNIEYELQVRVLKYLENLFIEDESENKEQEKIILNKLSDSLRKEVLIQSHGKILEGFSTFKKHFTNETLERMSQIVKVMGTAPDDIIFQVKSLLLLYEK